MKIKFSNLTASEIDIIEHRINILKKKKELTLHSYKKMQSKKISSKDITEVLHCHNLVECDISEDDFRVLLESKSEKNSKRTVVCLSLVSGVIITVYKRDRKYPDIRYTIDNCLNVMAAYNFLVRC